MAESQDIEVESDAFDASPHLWSSPIVQTLPLTAGPSTTNPKAPGQGTESALEPA